LLHAGGLLLNLSLVKPKIDEVDDVITQKLRRIVESHHGVELLCRLDEALPGWHQHKERLEPLQGWLLPKSEPSIWSSSCWAIQGIL
jgi:hypothetical protein